MLQKTISDKDFAKIILFLLFSIASCWVFEGIIPTILLLIGAIVSKINQRNEDFIRFVKVCEYYYILLSIISFVAVVYCLYVWIFENSYYYYHAFDNLKAFFWGFCFFLFQLLCFEFGLKKPIHNNIDNIKFFKKKFSVALPKKNNINILQSNSEIKIELASAADELYKWKKMLDEGAISADEYEKIKNKIINQ